jgi:hypothetical protein
MPFMLAGLLLAPLAGCVEQSWPPPANPSYPPSSPSYPDDPTPPPADIKIEYNTLRRGGDYAHFRSRNFETCVEQCKNDSRCLAMDFNIQDNTCRLKDRVSPAEHSTIYASGIKENSYSGYPPYPPQDSYSPGGSGRMRISRDTSRRGGDYKNYVVASVEECANACKRDYRCRAFDFEKRNGTCWMKSSVPTARRDRNVVSGVKEADNSGNYDPNPPGGYYPPSGSKLVEGMLITKKTTLPGGDYSNFTVRNIRECAKECNRDYRCRSFNFDKRSKRCWLKNSVPRARPDHNVTSGIKQADNSGGYTPPPSSGYYPPSSAPNDFNISYNTTRNGGDYNRVIAGSLQDCADICRRENRCRAFSYIQNTRQCWLKDSVPPARANRDVGS